MYKYTLQVSIKFYDSLASHSCIYDLVCYIKKMKMLTMHEYQGFIQAPFGGKLPPKPGNFPPPRIFGQL